MTAAAAGSIAPALTGLEAFAQSAAGLPYDAIAAIRAEAMGESTSQVMETASYLWMCWVRASRARPASASPATSRLQAQRVGDCRAISRMWPNDPRGTPAPLRGWSNSKFYLAAVSPNTFPVSGMSIALMPGTNGTRPREVSSVTETTERDPEGQVVRQACAAMGARRGASSECAMGPGRPAAAPGLNSSIRLMETPAASA